MTVDTIAEHWAQARADGQLELTRCRDCGRLVGYPRSRCPYCMSTEMEWQRLTGCGRIHSYTVNRRGAGRYADAGPYVIAYVELEEGPRLLAQLRVDAERDRIAIGDRVRVVASGPDDPLTFAPIP